MDKAIIKFIKEHHVFTLATCRNNMPYCSNMFYAWLEEDGVFVFTSSADTKHVKDAEQNSNVAGSVVFETGVIGKIRGVQFTGEMFRADGKLLENAKSRYFKRFPFAVMMDLDLWILKPNFIKLTDNRLGFGKKIVWKI